MEGHVSVLMFNAMVLLAFTWGMVLGWIMFRRSREDAAIDAELIDQALSLIGEAELHIKRRADDYFPPAICKRLQSFRRHIETVRGSGIE